MTSALHTELSALLQERSEALTGAMRVKGANDRVDAITLLCREILRTSSLCYIGGDMHFFGGLCYIPCEKGAVSAVLGNLLVDMGVSPTDVRKMAEMPLSVISERSFSRGRLLCFANGVLDLSDMSFRADFDPRLIVTECLPYRYLPDAECPRWNAFLAEVMPDEAERMCLQEFMGLCYLDRSKISVEKFAIFLGKGANGKSVIHEVLSKTFGEGSVAGYDAEQLTKSELIPYLNGKRINFAADMKASAAFDSALKALSSGQEVVGRKIYGEPVSVKAPPIVFSMNKLPKFRDDSDAFFRRVLLFSFDVVIPEERRDTSLADKICAAELPGVFNWVMAGCERLAGQRGRFTPCPKMDAALKKIRGEVEDERAPVRAYLESRGLSVVPLYHGQAATRVWQSEIRIALHGMSATAITQELARFGVRKRKSGEIYYEVYKKD